MLVDDDGYFWFVLREDDIIKSSGYRIGPEEIEVTIAEHPAVADVDVYSECPTRCAAKLPKRSLCRRLDRP